MSIDYQRLGASIAEHLPALINDPAEADQRVDDLGIDGGTGVDDVDEAGGEGP